MRTASIFASYEPIHNYLRMTEDNQCRLPETAMSLQPIDAFILRQFAECYPGKLAIVDMAAEASFGASTVFFAAQNQIGKVLVIEDHYSLVAKAPAAWKELVQDALTDDAQQIARVAFLPHGRNALESESDLRKHIGPLHQPVFIIATDDKNSDRLWAEVNRLLIRHSNAIVFLLPLGSVGNCRSLESALALCHSESSFQFALLREVSPFCASSKLGLIYSRSNRHIPEVLQRIHQFFEGNFDFLEIIEANVELQTKMQVCLEKCEQMQSELVGVNEDLARVRRALASRTKELEAAYATTTGGKPKGRRSKPVDSTDETDDAGDSGQALADVGAVMSWLKRGSR